MSGEDRRPGRHALAVGTETAMETFGRQFRSHEVKVSRNSDCSCRARGHAGRAGDQMAVVDNYDVTIESGVRDKVSAAHREETIIVLPR